MQTVILPGFSPENKEWADQVASKLSVDGQIRPILWDHWYDTEEKFYPKEKATLIARHSRGDTVNIIAKSIGVLVAAHIIEQIPAQINKVIICGIPLNDLNVLERDVIKKSLEKIDSQKLICFQNDADPHGNFNEAKEFLGDKINLVSKAGDTHDYPYYEEFNSFLA